MLTRLFIFDEKLLYLTETYSKVMQMEKRKKDAKEESFLRLLTIVDDFIKNCIEMEPETYLYPN